jgi:hypothetical protein
VLDFPLFKKLTFPWSSWKYYSLPQVRIIPSFASPRPGLLTSCVCAALKIMLLRWVEDNLQRNAFQPGPLQEVDLSRVLEDKPVRQEVEEDARQTNE